MDAIRAIPRAFFHRVRNEGAHFVARRVGRGRLRQKPDSYLVLLLVGPRAKLLPSSFEGLKIFPQSGQ